MAGLPGFTLIELVIVLLIVGVFLSLISISIDSVLSGGDLRRATRMIAGRIKLLRGRAAYTRKAYYLGFNIDRNTVYAIDGGIDPAPPREGRMSEIFSLPRGVNLTDVVVLSRGKVQEGEARIQFSENGLIEKALIHLENENGDVYTLSINPATGVLTVHDRYVEQRYMEQ